MADDIIIDNKNNKLNSVLENRILENSSLEILVHNFTLYAYAKMRDTLHRLKSAKILIEDDEYLLDKFEKKNEAMQFMLTSEGLDISNVLQQKFIVRDCSEWLKNKVQIKVTNKKDYIRGCLYQIFNEDGSNFTTVGTSSFNKWGLGLSSDRVYLNVEITDKKQKEDLSCWFNSLWNDDSLCYDIKNKLISSLRNLYKDYSPQLVYYKTLYRIFEKFIDDDKGIAFESEKYLTDTVIWRTLFDYQKDGVRSAINKINKYNGCIIADSVGLGKTYEALGVIKFFEQKNFRVMVLCPKRLRNNWIKFVTNTKDNPFLMDKFRYDVLCHTDLSRKGGYSGNINLDAFYWDNYDLVVIDESHNFRNVETGYKKECSRYYKLLNNVLKSGVRSRVLLLSATPVNNTLEDLKNQLSLITLGDNNAFETSLGIASLSGLISKTKGEFHKWSKSDDKTQDNLLNLLNSEFFLLLDQLSIARSRKHIRKYYKTNLDKAGSFPMRNKPVSIYSNIDCKGEFISYNEINDIIINCKLAIYSPSHYLFENSKNKYQKKYDYENFKQTDRESYLSELIKINLMKRIESSVNSFSITIKNLIDHINNIKELINKYKNSKYQIEMNLYDENEDEIDQEDFIVGNKRSYELSDIDTGKWLMDLEYDLKKLNYLYAKSSEITPERDNKLNELMKIINKKVNNPTIDKKGKINKKILVFTAFKDTADYLYNNILPMQKKLGIEIGKVTGVDVQCTKGKNKYEDILNNFSPLGRKIENNEVNIDLLIATDCISEGQDLHDCDLVVNYDIHWNPIRMIQRFGRIDRIGSLNEYVSMINFWPTDDLEQYINLKQRVEDKMMLSNITSTNSDNILDPQANTELLNDSNKYREKQLLSMKNEILDLEDFDGGVTLTDFSMDDFRTELLNFLKSNKQILEKIPDGVNVVTSFTNDNLNIKKTGVVFCLKKKVFDEKHKRINILDPFYLIYLTDENIILYNFQHSKRTLETMRSVCAAKKYPEMELIKQFNILTQNGKNLDKYNKLLSIAINSISGKFNEISVKNIFQSVNYKLSESDKSKFKFDDFELISWFVIL